MKLYGFLRLSEVDQFNYVWPFDFQVDTYIKENTAINLYVINDFYCKVHYDMKTNNILYKKTFKQGEL
jgi:hypothetical protein